MKHLASITRIAALSCLGELCHALIPLPIPGSIYGLLLMLLCLCTGILKLHQVKTVSDWLITLMPVMFVGPTVGLIVSFDSLRAFLVPLILTATLSTVIVMAVTGRCAQWLIRKTEGKEPADVE